MVKRSTPLIALHGAGAASIALCSALALPTQDGQPPEWIHLLPAGEIRTADGRGPYRVDNAAALVQASLQASSGPLVLDENHATDLAGPKGEPAPARGWITDLEARSDGIWGKVDWTRSGKRLMADKAYRHISPVITHLEDGRVTGILRASLINRPNLKGLVALQQEQIQMDFLKKIAAALGLGEDATPEAILAAISKLKEAPATALQAALDPIAVAAGLAAGSDATAVLAGVQGLTSGSASSIVALQSELASVTNRLNALTTSTKSATATAFVDGAIKLGRVGVKPMRAEYIAMHMENPARAEQLVNAMPILGGGGTIIPQVDPPTDGKVSLNAEQSQVASMLGLAPETYAKTIAGERRTAL